MSKPSSSQQYNQPPPYQEPAGSQAGAPQPGQPQKVEYCGICKKVIADNESGCALACGHNFHAVCINPWLMQQMTTCPVCKTPFTVNMQDPSTQPQNVQQNQSQAPPTMVMFNVWGRRPLVPLLFRPRLFGPRIIGPRVIVAPRMRMGRRRW